MNIKKTVAENIKRRREQLEMSGYRLAQLIGKDKQNIYSMEKGEANPTVTTLQLYADALDCEVWELLKPFELANINK